jgi:hypothetical protein
MAEARTPVAEATAPLPTGIPELEAGGITAPKAKKTLSNPYLQRLQRRHFLVLRVVWG